MALLLPGCSNSSGQSTVSFSTSPHPASGFKVRSLGPLGKIPEWVKKSGLCRRRIFLSTSKTTCQLSWQLRAVFNPGSVGNNPEGCALSGYASSVPGNGTDRKCRQ